MGLKKKVLSFFLIFSVILHPLFFFLSPKQALAAPPENFVNETLFTNLNQPTGIEFLPDGRLLVITRFGSIRIAQPGSTQLDTTPVLTLTNINTEQGERGLVGITKDPQFSENGYIYVFYTANSPLRDRVSRFTMTGNTASLSSEVVLWQDNVTAEFWHHGGTVAFGPDGKLYISTGDGFDTSSGSNHVSQRLNSYHGKILRINSDGTVPIDNPFYDGSGPNLDAIWARGLRNPFRFTFDSVTGRMLIADVGGNSAVSSIEEVNQGVAGANYGWPICEGSCGTSGMTNPIFVDPHGGRDSSITGGFFYRGGNFPSEYEGTYFYGNYVENWIRRLTFNANGSVNQNINFEPANGATDGPYGEIVDLKQGLDGALYYVDIGITWEGSSNPGTVRRIKYIAANQPPVISSVSGTPLTGPSPLSVDFSVSASDPEEGELTYNWTFGDGETSNEQNPTHVYTENGRYTARVTVSDGTNETLSDTLDIVVGTPPVATINTPLAGGTFRGGDVIFFSGSATDPDGTLTAENYSWTINLIHDTHTHPEEGPISGVTSGTFTIPTTGHGLNDTTSFQFVLTVTDEDGLTDSKAVIISPETVELTFDTVPSGLAVNFDQETNVVTPFTRNSLINFTHTIEAPSPQTLNGSNYEFSSWSDEGSGSHVITVPDQDQTLIATFTENNPTPTPTPTPSPTPTPIPGLLAAYSFDEGAGSVANDSSSNNRNLTLTGSPTWNTQGRYGGALNFDGSNDRGSVANFTLPSQFTYMAWVNNPSNQAWETIITTGSPRDWYLNNGSFGFHNGSSDLSFGASLPTGSWQHVALTYNGNQMRFYLNGTPVGNIQNMSLGNITNTLQVGAWINGSNNFDFFSGTLDEIRIYNSALSQAEIQTAMNTPLNASATPTPTPTPTQTPSPTPAPTPSLTPSPSPTPTPTLTPTPTSTPVPTPDTSIIRMAVMSDSTSDEYRADDNRAGGTPWEDTTLSWTELLVNERDFDLGLWGNRSEPRRTGYEYNWARSGATADSLISSGQHTGVSSQVADGLINIVYFQIGNNDFAYYNDGAAIYNGTISGQALTNKINGVVEDIELALNAVLSSNPNIRVVLGTIPDPGQTVYWQSQFPNATNRQRVTDAIAQVNAQIMNMASSRVIIFDQEEFAENLLSSVDAQGNLVVGGELITLLQNGNEPHNAILADNIHGGTVLEGLFANAVIDHINEALGTNIMKFTESEILANAGIVVSSPTPTPTPSPSPTPTPTPTPSPTPSSSPTPTPSPTATTITRQVSSSSDDVNQVNNTLENTSILWIGNDSGTSLTAFRFTNMPIPQGATIINAYLEVYSPQSSWISLSFSIRGQNSGNSATFSTSSLPSSRPLTTAVVNHSSNVSWSANTWYQLNNISSIVQEIVNRGDWQSGNSMAIIMQGTGGNWARKFIRSYNANASQAPRLVVTYQ